MTGLRDALAAKQVLTTFYDIPQKPRPVVDEIVGRLNDARQRAYIAAGAAKKAAEKDVAKVKAELDACFHRVEFRALEDDADMDALVNAHPATEAQKAKDPEAEIEMDGFNVDYLVACVQDSDLTADEWQAELWSPRWTRADRNAIFAKVHEANQYEFNAGIPKE